MTQGYELAVRVKISLKVGSGVKSGESLAEIGQVVGKETGESMAATAGSLACRDWSLTEKNGKQIVLGGLLHPSVELGGGEIFLDGLAGHLFLFASVKDAEED